MKVPFVIYADFEAIIKKIDVVCGYSYVIVRCDGQSQPPKVYSGRDASKHFLDAIIEEKEPSTKYLKT